MTLSLDDIEITIYKMDKHYDANFGIWVRNEKNAAIVGYHLNKYIDDYNTSDFIVVIKWIVRSWTLRSIIILSKSMVLYDIQNMSNSRKSENYKNFKSRTCILSGLIYTWSNIFIVEFLLAFSKNLNTQQKCKFFVNMLVYFENSKKQILIKLINSKTENKVRNVLSRAFTYNKKNKGRSRGINKDIMFAFSVS